MSAQKSDAQGDGANHVTWEILWLNSIVLAWGHKTFSELLLEEAWTRKCLGAVLIAICPQTDKAHRLPQFVKNLVEDAKAAITEQLKVDPKILDTVLPPWVRLKVRPCPKDQAEFGYSADGWSLPRVEVTVPLPKKDIGGQAGVEFLVCEMTSARMGGWPFDGRGNAPAVTRGLESVGNSMEGLVMLKASAAPAAPAARAGFESPIPAFEQTQRWFYVWTKVLASATPRSKLRQRLMKDPSLALLDEFGFSVPSGTSIKFTEQDTKEKYRIGVVMYLPSTPDEDYRAVALANYAEMGRTYPFTLCFC